MRKVGDIVKVKLYDGSTFKHVIQEGVIETVYPSGNCRVFGINGWEWNYIFTEEKLKEFNE